MYYIGCHWGTIDDGYICSSNRMRNAYRRRPHDFKRRIIQKITDRSVLFEEEHKWLQLISDDQLGKKYYNIRKHRWGHWTTDVNNSRTISEKISQKVKEYRRLHPESEEHRRKKREIMIKRWNDPISRDKIIASNCIPSRLGKTHSEKTKKLLSEKRKGRPAWNKGLRGLKHKNPRSKEHCKKISELRKNKPLSEFHKLKLKEAWIKRKQKYIEA